MPQLHKRLHQLKSLRATYGQSCLGKTSSSRKSKRGGNRQDREGKGGKWRIRGERKKPREKTPGGGKQRLSEAITSIRFEKAQDCLTQVTFTLLSKLKYSAHVQVSHLSGSGEFPPARASRAAQEHRRTASWPPPGSVTENCLAEVWGAKGQRGRKDK